MPEEKVSKADHLALVGLHAATNVAVEGLKSENTKLREKNQFLENQLETAQTAINIGKQTLEAVVTSSNEQKEALAQELKIVQTELAELKKE